MAFACYWMMKELKSTDSTGPRARDAAALPAGRLVTKNIVGFDHDLLGQRLAALDIRDLRGQFRRQQQVHTVANFGHVELEILADLGVRHPQHDHRLQVVIGVLALEIDRKGLQRHEHWWMRLVDDDLGWFGFVGLCRLPSSACLFFESSRKAAPPPTASSNTSSTITTISIFLLFLGGAHPFDSFRFGRRLRHYILLVCVSIIRVEPALEA